MWKYWITGVVSAMVIALGFVGNLTAIFILRKPKMSTAFNQLLIVLCVFDTIFLVMNIPTTELAFQSRKYPLILLFFLRHPNTALEKNVVQTLSYQISFRIINVSHIHRNLQISALTFPFNMMPIYHYARKKSHLPIFVQKESF